ncbi:unnamed protein product, partial [Polarella glacialis]
ARVARHFAALDVATAALASQAPGLRCPPGCGACCLSPEVEATALECGPLAASAVASDGGAALLSALDAAEIGGSQSCVLYQSSSPDGKRGRCSQYALRPSLCRLFGFATRSSKSGSPTLAACVVMRSAAPVAVQQAERLVASRQVAAPSLSGHYHALHLVCPNHAIQVT